MSEHMPKEKSAPLEEGDMGSEITEGREQADLRAAEEGNLLNTEVAEAEKLPTEQRLSRLKRIGIYTMTTFAAMQALFGAMPPKAEAGGRRGGPSVLETVAVIGGVIVLGGIAERQEETRRQREAAQRVAEMQQAAAWQAYMLQQAALQQAAALQAAEAQRNALQQAAEKQRNDLAEAAEKRQVAKEQLSPQAKRALMEQGERQALLDYKPGGMMKPRADMPTPMLDSYVKKWIELDQQNKAR